MKHIEKIIINNARRFGKNVEIDFGKGATIILAPNGTGKTTVFEAIELALTGEIKRLENFPEAIIRDGFLKMSTRLEFLEGKYCQVDYSKGEERILKGNHGELFSVESKSSLPYLFRLTHLLEQRGGEWFVEKGEKDAGNILRQLPIGKDLGEIIKKKTSCLKEIGARIKKAEIDLSTAKKVFSEFETLKAERDGLATEITLPSLKEIASKLVLIGKSTNHDGYKEDYNLTQINTYFERIRVSFQQESKAKKDLLIRLNVLKERVPQFISNIDLLGRIQAVISEHLNKITVLKNVSKITEKGIQDAIVSINAIKNEIKELNMVKSLFEEVDQKTDYLGVKRAELEQYENELFELTNSYKTTIDYLKKNERLRDQYILTNDAINKNKNILFQIEQKRNFIKQWLEISKINQEIIEKTIPEIDKKMSGYISEKSLLDDKVLEASEIHLVNKNTLESLSKASGAIQEAVSNIRKHLTEEQQKCPVCQAIYEPGDLIKRIEESLNTLNPAIPIAIKEAENANINFELAKGKQKDNNQRLYNIQSERNAESLKLDSNKKKISESYFILFPECRTPEEANIQLEEQSAQINLEIKGLELSKSILEPEVSVEEIDNANLKKQEEERLINERTAKIEKIQKEIIIGTEGINSINDLLIGKDKGIVVKNLSILLEEEMRKKEFIQKSEEIVSKNDEDLKKCQNGITSETEAASKIKGNQEGISTEWSQAGLEGQPNEEKLKTNHEVVLKVILDLEKANTDLNTIEQDLASWRSAEKFHEVDNMLKNQIGNSSEADYLESLKTAKDKRGTELLSIQKKSKVVNLLLENIVSENNQIHKQLDSINEPWRGLLKRIVINPLISTAPLMSNSNLRNQPLATTSANIHKQNIDIVKIASEAQLSDLQLTLMLAMANKFQWTSWKALLLDDPTQHHDLVHASSVFDVLRDYIINFDYQVMMSTHDSMQANFFRRKLENEGVPSKIYQLVSRKDGVTAERVI